jgi:hypothetical protein
MGGLAAWREDWIEFCAQWQAALTKYGAPYFHFCEWRAASVVARGKKANSSFQKNPFKGWAASKLDDFLYELADIAGSGNKVTIGGWIETASFHQAKVSKDTDPRSIPAGGDPYRHVIEQFFANLSGDIQSAWPYWTEPVSLFFDQHDDPQWCAAIHEAFNASRKKDHRLKELVFADKKDPLHLPLQAADMSVYRFRQLADAFGKEKFQLAPLPKLDALLMKGMFGQFDRVGYSRPVTK